MSLYTAAAGAINALLRPAGYQVVRLPSPPNNCRFRSIERMGIDLVFDIGANVGQYAMELRRHGYRGRIISFEPLPDAFAALSAHASGDPLWDVRNAAVGAEPGRLPMHVSANSVSSSLLEVTEASTAAAPESRASGTVEVEVVTLDKPLAEARGAKILLKVDTQGYEWPVLQGCGATLGHVAMLDVEMSLQPLYAGQKLFDEVEAFILEQGFARIGYDTSFWNRDSGALLQIDGIYGRA